MEHTAKTAAPLLEELRAALQGNETAEYLNGLGARLHQARQPEAALQAFELACKRAPQQPNNWMAVAALRLELQRPQAALEACNHALRLAPDHAQVLFSTGVVLAALNDKTAALYYYNKALSIQPDHHGALCNRPMLLADSGRMDEARQAAQKAIAAYPQDPWLRCNFGELLIGMHAAPEAAAAFRAALALAPGLHQARYALSIALAMNGDLPAAYHERNLALQQQPELEANYRSPVVYDALTRGADCRPERIAAVAIIVSVYACNWSKYEENARLLADLVVGTGYSKPLSGVEFPYATLLLPVPAETRRQMARQAMSALEAQVRDAPMVRPQRQHNESRRLTIAYLSADFNAHVMTWLLGSMYARHDRNRFRVLAYSTVAPNESDECQQVQSGVDRFHDVQSHTPQTIAQLMLDDEVDILVDLSGYTMNAKPAVLALRPAPIQVSYLGFLGTMGTAHIDYALLDRDSMPAQQREFWDESIAYLPDTSIYCERHVTDVHALERAEYGLPEQGTVLCALHMARKLDPVSFRVWLELLAEIPDSVLWLVGEAELQIQSLFAFAQSQGIDRDRLVFAPLLPRARHLARYRHADVFLDTFGFNGHTTVIDGLSMNVPVVSMPGEAPHARGAASILRAHGVPELVANSVHDYKEIVKRLCADIAWRNSIRSRLENGTNSRLFCPEHRVREIETAYEMMWARHQAGLPPVDFDVPEWRPAT